jgi:hypothetical protein
VVWNAWEDDAGEPCQPGRLATLTQE